MEIYLLCFKVVSGKVGSVLVAIRVVSSNLNSSHDASTWRYDGLN